MRTVYLRVRRAITPPTEDHRPALRVALGLAIPGVALLAAGRPDLIIYAVFGAITGMYGRTETRGRRFAHQTQGGVILVLGVAIGVALANSHVPPAVLVIAAVAFASIGSVVTDYLALKPEGPFYGVFALGAIATVPAGRVTSSSAILLCAATALLCVLLGVLDAPRAVTPPARLSLPNRRDVLIHAGRYALAIAAAAGPLAAADASGRIRRGIHRLGGTFIGLAVAAALLVPGPSEYVLAICVMVLLFPTELFMAHHHAVALGFFTPLIMLMTDLAAPTEPLVLLTARGIDTIIGVTAAIAVSMLLPGARD
ncbi:FUSC family protein [Mycobacterium sp. SMC-21]|uniref:FUSC family protein n=1 Tax=Mycobacterium sp. SMC-21 TaxID=3381632 RepID=UPI003875B8D3